MEKDMQDKINVLESELNELKQMINKDNNKKIVLALEQTLIDIHVTNPIGTVYEELDAIGCTPIYCIKHNHDDVTEYFMQYYFQETEISYCFSFVVKKGRFQWFTPIENRFWVYGEFDMKDNCSVI